MSMGGHRSAQTAPSPTLRGNRWCRKEKQRLPQEVLILKWHRSYNTEGMWTRMRGYTNY